jgi:hypothetical protein
MRKGRLDTRGAPSPVKRNSGSRADVGRGRTPRAGPIRATAAATAAGDEVLHLGILRRSRVVPVVVAVASGCVMHRIDHHGVVVRLAASRQRENVTLIVLGQVIRRSVLELELKRRSSGCEGHIPGDVVYVLGEAAGQNVSKARGKNLIRLGGIGKRNGGLPLIG